MQAAAGLGLGVDVHEIHLALVEALARHGRSPDEEVGAGRRVPYFLADEIAQVLERLVPGRDQQDRAGVEQRHDGLDGHPIDPASQDTVGIRQSDGTRAGADDLDGVAGAAPLVQVDLDPFLSVVAFHVRHEEIEVFRG